MHCLGWYTSNVSLSSILPSRTLPRLWRNGTDPTHGVADTRRMRLFHLSLGSLLQFRTGLDALSQLAVVRPSENAVTLGGPSVQCLRSGRLPRRRTFPAETGTNACRGRLCVVQQREARCNSARVSGALDAPRSAKKACMLSECAVVRGPNRRRPFALGPKFLLFCASLVFHMCVEKLLYEPRVL